VHSSGVTRRSPEFAIYNRKIQFKDDFDNELNKFQFKDFFTATLISALKSIFVKTGIYSSCDSDSDFLNTKNWVLSIRGHYSKRNLSSETIFKVYTKLLDGGNVLIENSQPASLAVHFRLGDLESLAYKSSIEETKIAELIRTVTSKYNLSEVFLYSDSPDLAESKLSRLLPNLRFTSRKLTPIETVLECTHSVYFIGTNSKLSVWIALFRTVLLSSPKCYLPIDMKKMLEINQKIFTSKKIEIY
jgi:hypothetical protein